MKKSTLVSGAFGFLGNIICRSLLNYDFYVDTIDLDQNATFVNDISKEISPFSKKYELVVHSAGLAHILSKTKEEENQFYEINYQGTINICKAFEAHPPNTFVFISTIAAYGKDIGTELEESTALEGTTPYAKSKIMAEEFLLDWCKEFDVNLVVLRLPLVAGSKAKGNLGAMVKGIKKGYYFNIKKSKAKKSIVLAEDIARLIPNLIGHKGIYNLAGDKDYTFKEISDIIRKQLGDKKVLSLPNWIVKFLAKVGDIIKFFPLNSATYMKMTNDLTVSAEKAKNELAWNPRPLSNYKI